MKEIFYSVRTPGTSTRKACQWVNEQPDNQNKVFCYDYEGGGIWVRTNSDPMGVKHKIERQLDIELGNPIY
ncbi:MAG: hypothetical protein TYPL_3710 [Candidatus Tyloplasma litorale]|nr:MAG: hypothetical protein TYPL_3710 [Mycoplasmatales bacterium]